MRAGRARSFAVGPPIWLAAVCLLTCAGRAPADTLIDNFERTNAPAPWTFYNGAEFPGATGSLSSGPGYSGQGAHLAYNLSQGGHYVSANLTLPTPLSPAAVSFWLRSPTNITISLRVVDSSGQTLQYTLRRPLENLDPAAWYQQSVPLDSATGWWGGANDGHLRNPINSLSILAGDPLQPGPVGAIDFDEVTALTSATFDLNPAAQALIPGPPGGGDLFSRLGVNIHFTSDDHALDLAHGAGLNWVRMDLAWAAVEGSPNVYDWSAYDNLINSLRTRGMKALLILDYGNALYTGSGGLPPTNSTAIEAFGNFANAAARHFAGSGARFEIWNEPNGSGFWPPAANPAQYASLARLTSPRLNQGDPSVPVVTGGLSGFDFGFFTGYLPLGGAIGANAVGVHPYDCNPPELLSDRLMFLRALAAQYVTNSPPVWDTEWGFSSTWFGDGHSTAARQRQAILVARELLSASAAGFPLIIYYDIRDDGTNSTDGENNFGLLANDYTDKPAMRAVRALGAVARTRRFSGFIHTVPANLTALRFDGRTNLVVALWSSTTAGQATVTVPTNTTATDFLGAPLALLNWTNRLAWTIYESNGPVYFSFPYTWQATNLGPALAPLSNRTATAGATLSISNAATYWDAPPQALTYSLVTPPAPPAGAGIDSAAGLFTWRPTLAQSNTTNVFGIAVADSGTPSLGATQFFTITVLSPARPVFTDSSFSNGVFHSLITGDEGPDYSILGSHDLQNWTSVVTLSSPATPFLFSDAAQDGAERLFYRVRLGP
jgi:hypothetical protein